MGAPRITATPGIALRLVDGGCTPGTLARLLSQVVIPAAVVLHAGDTAEELRAFIMFLKTRVLALAASQQSRLSMTNSIRPLIEQRRSSAARSARMIGVN